MTFTYTFDDRDENGPDLTIEVGADAGSPACRYNEYPADPAEWWIGEIADDDGNKYDEDYFTKEEWQRIENAAESELESA
jgi:hypothetical protein